MITHVLIDYSQIRKGDLKAIEYPRPLCIHLFLDSNALLAVEDTVWLEGEDLSLERVLVNAANAASVPFMMAIRASTEAASNPVATVFVVSSSSSLAIAVESSELRSRVKVFRQIASLPISADGSVRRTGKVRDLRLTVMAGVVSAFFVTLVCAFLLLLGTFTNSVGKTLLFDFGAYLLPGLAAVAAGIGLFLKRWEPAFYFGSALCVFGGLICYMNSKPEFAKVVPHDPHALFVSTTWCVAAVTGLISCAGLLALNRVTYGPRQRIDNVQKRLRWFYWMLGAVNLVVCLPLIALSVQMRLDPNHWHDQGRLHVLYSLLASIL
ncbi:hypothetical protein [Luteibacter sp. 9135]|uniref:hypothetical protein n=1 Tax=Luteibacter sp. 9135 TaxID=1500893 RepID=UPI001639B076|nr:hypothetical protein [Luteibacter sp. 9135]